MLDRLFPSRHVRDFRRCLIGLRPAFDGHFAWADLEDRLTRASPALAASFRQRVLEGEPMQDIVADVIIGTCLGDIEIAQDMHGGRPGKVAQSMAAICRQAIASQGSSGWKTVAEVEAAQGALTSAMTEFA